MFHPKKPSSVCGSESRACVQAAGAASDSGLVLTTDPKPRLRWTVELHERFVDAVTQLGGPDKATPKTIMRVMGVKGLTLYHLKSHLQKFRLGKQPHKEFNDHMHVVKDGKRVSNMDLQRNKASSSGIMGRTMNDNVHITDAIRMQVEVQRRLQEQLEVQRHLQLRIEAQAKYMQNILEKACQTLAGETNLASSSPTRTGGIETFKGVNVNATTDIPHDMVAGGGPMKDFISPLNIFPSLEDLSIYNTGGGREHQTPIHLHLQNHRPHNYENFILTQTNNSNKTISLGRSEKKRPNPYHHHDGSKSQVIWSDDLRLHPELRNQDDPFKGDQIQIGGGSDIDSSVFESPPLLGCDVMREKEFDRLRKVERPSPRRPSHMHVERTSPLTSIGTLAQGRNSPFG